MGADPLGADPLASGWTRYRIVGIVVMSFPGSNFSHGWTPEHNNRCQQGLGRYIKQ